MENLLDHIPYNGFRSLCAENNDALAWTEGFMFRYQGINFGLRTNRLDSMEMMKTALPPNVETSDKREVDVLLSFWIGEPSGRKGSRNFHIVYDGWTRAARTVDLEEAFEQYLRSLRGNIALFAQDSIFIVGEAVALQGKAVLICGPSKSGNSTLAEALAQNGGVRYSRGLVEVDHNGKIVSYEDPSLQPITPCLILAANYEEGRSWKPKKLKATEAALTLLALTPTISSSPERVLKVVSQLASKTPTYKGRRGEAETLTRFVMRRLSESPDPVG